MRVRRWEDIDEWEVENGESGGREKSLLPFLGPP
jgi:hypothetical protein